MTLIVKESFEFDQIETKLGIPSLTLTTRGYPSSTDRILQQRVENVPDTADSVSIKLYLTEGRGLGYQVDIKWMPDTADSVSIKLYLSLVYALHAMLYFVIGESAFK